MTVRRQATPASNKSPPLLTNQPQMAVRSDTPLLKLRLVRKVGHRKQGKHDSKKDRLHQLQTSLFLHLPTNHQWQWHLTMNYKLACTLHCLDNVPSGYWVGLEVTYKHVHKLIPPTKRHHLLSTYIPTQHIHCIYKCCPRTCGWQYMYNHIHLAESAKITITGKQANFWLDPTSLA